MQSKEGNVVIPKIIHYCWFGGKQLPDEYKKNIASWRKYCPEYEIREWNESNFDVNCCAYIKEAYKAKKWAFVSDYARFWILYRYGGIYFDTDVEMIKPIDGLISKGGFIGTEIESKNGFNLAVAPGLGMAANPGLGLFAELLDMYNDTHFIKSDGSINKTTVVEYMTKQLYSHGYIANNSIQKICGIYVYPPEYFSPMNQFTGEIKITDNTYTIHHYSGSWLDWENRLYHKVNRSLKNRKILNLLWNFISLPLRIEGKIRVFGIRNTLSMIKKRIHK